MHSLYKVEELLTKKFGWFRGSKRIHIFADSAFPGFITDVKSHIFNEPSDWATIDHLKAQANKYGQKLGDYMYVVPVSFNQYGLEMLTKVQSFVSDGMLQVPKSYQDLITQMRTVKLKPNYNIDKEHQSFDLIDALRLSCFNIGKRSA